MDLTWESTLARIMATCSKDGLITGAHDLSEGGLAQALVESALRQARDAYADALAWLVFPDAARAQTDPDPGTVDSWFAPAKDKTYKQQQYYGTIGRHVGELKRAGGAPYIHTLVSTVPTAANAGYYAQIVAERAVLRRLVDADALPAA